MKKNIIFLLIVLLIADLTFSFFQHYHQPLDGDMAGGIVPYKDVNKILDDPLGISVIKNGEKYPNPNRFFCHWIFYQYYNRVPQFFQYFTDPISSIYLANAVIKTTIQFFFIFILSSLICNTKRIFDKNFLVTSILITSLIQTNGFQTFFGIIDKSSTYAFFYALPLLFLMIYLFPLLNSLLHNKELKIKKWNFIIIIPLSLLCGLSGPLNTGIALIIILMISSFIIFPPFKSLNIIPMERLKTYLLWLLPLGIVSVYSIFLNSFNINDESMKHSLLSIFSKIPEGLINHLTTKIGFPLLIICIIINYLILKKQRVSKKIQIIIVNIVCFSILYILLLPFGGYRDYRPNTIRYDTLLPISTLLIFAFAFTGKNILENTSKRLYILYLIFIALIFTISDKPEFDNNSCEVVQLTKLRNTKKNHVVLPKGCSVLSWNTSERKEVLRLNSILLNRWNITEKIITYDYK